MPVNDFDIDVNCTITTTIKPNAIYTQTSIACYFMVFFFKYFYLVLFALFVCCRCIIAAYLHICVASAGIDNQNIHTGIIWKTYKRSCKFRFFFHLRIDVVCIVYMSIECCTRVFDCCICMSNYKLLLLSLRAFFPSYSYSISRFHSLSLSATCTVISGMCKWHVVHLVWSTSIGCRFFDNTFANFENLQLYRFWQLLENQINTWRIFE